MSELFEVSSVNPNHVSGGGGCLCSETTDIDCKPPYVIFYGQSLENPQSPHAVACQRCIDAAAKALQGETLTAGEVVIDSTGYEVTEEEAQENSLHEFEVRVQRRIEEDSEVLEQLAGSTAGDDIPEV
jgi:hypothetical protein